MLGILIKINLTLAVALQLNSVGKVYDFGGSQGQAISISSSETLGVAGLSAQDKPTQSSDTDSTPPGHCHCKSHPTGSCYAYLSFSEIKVIPNLIDLAYGIQSNFFFFELVSSHLRPPAITA